ncbi:MAG: hypothetical protein NT121_21780 [Chloroflexi bacterium]|nr:hypothetical protein [Chloroflexota bacterium]
MVKKNLSKLLAIILITATLSCSLFSGLLPTNGGQISVNINAEQGGELNLGEMKIIVPPGSLRTDTIIFVQKNSDRQQLNTQQEFYSVGDEFKIDIEKNNIVAPITLEIPFDPTQLPSSTDPSQVFLSYFDDATGRWVFAGGKVDVARSVIILPVTHASLWRPATWNWGAWIALLSKTLGGDYIDLVDAEKLLTNDCPTIGKYIQVDESQAHNMIQGCIEDDNAEQPKLRIVNPKSIFYEIRPISGGNGYPSPELLAPGDSVEFTVSTLDPSPLVISAEMTQKSSWYLVIHMVIKMLPGANQLGFQSKNIACLTERLQDVSYFVSAVESLSVAHNGASAALSIRDFMKDKNAVRRFITAADDCSFGPALTWSDEGFKQIAGATNTIISATDYIANYLAGNSYSQVSFSWKTPTTKLDSVQVGGSDPFFLTYDKNLWYATNNVEMDGGSLQNTLDLKSNPECILYQYIPLGTMAIIMPPPIQEDIGGYVFQITENRLASNGNLVKIEFYYQYTLDIGLMINDNSDAGTCLNEAKIVLKNSANNNFGPNR